MKYPFVVLFRNVEYNFIDNFFEINKDKLLFTIIKITNKLSDLNSLFNENELSRCKCYHLNLFTFQMPIIYFVIRLFLLGYLPTFTIPI